MKRIYYLVILLFTVQAMTAQNDAVLSSINTHNYHAVGSNIIIEATISNAGANTINSINLNWNDGFNSSTNNISGLSIAPGATADVSHSVALNVAAGTIPVTVTITSVNNSTDDNPSDNSGIINISGVTFVPQKYVILEQGSGTWCGWCPRGYVEMEYLENTYPQTLLGISVHTSDPLEVSAYSSGLGNIISGYPGGAVDRSALDLSTPNYEAAHNTAANNVAPAELSFTSVTYDNVSRVLTAELSAEFVAALSGDYRLNLILVENDVTGTTSSYNQSNYYSGGSTLSGAGHDWHTEADPVPAASMEYDHVARDILGGFTGQANSLPVTIAAGETHSYTFSTTLPADWDENNIRLIGALQDNENSTVGKFLNGVPKQLVLSNDAALSSINTAEYQVIGDNIAIESTVSNLGASIITSMDITWSDGTNSYTDNLSGLNIAPQGTYDVSHSTLFPVTAGTTSITVTITNVNGGLDEDTSNNSADIDITGATFIPQKYVIIEEGAATWSGFSPRGYVYMDYMQNTYPGTFLGVSVHNGSPMESAYHTSGFSSIISGFPSGIVDRSDNGFIDPTAYEAGHNAVVNDLAPAELSFTNITYDNTTRVLTADLSAEFVIPLSGDYRLNLILVEDDVTGTTSGYNQNNFYSGGGTPLAGAGHDWQAEPNPVLAANMEYDHVARDILGGFTGQANSLPISISAGSIHSYTFSTTLPADWDYENIRLIGALQDNENSSIGKFLNGVPGEILCSIDGIQNGDETGIDCGGSSCVPCAVAPSITSHPADATTFEGTTTTFSIVAENTTNYQWYESTDGGTSYSPISDNGVYAGATTATLSITPTLAMDGNLYQCLVVGAVNPPAISSSATLYVNPLVPPSITSQPVDATTTEGESTTFSIVAENGTGYQWYESTNGGTNYNPINDNNIYAGTNTATLIVTPTLAMDGNLYQCLVTGNTNPPAISNSATLYVNPIMPPSIISQPADAATFEEVPVTFNVVAENATNYQWYESTNGGTNYNPISDNGIYAGTTTATLIVTPTLPMDGNLYQCLVTGDVFPLAISNSATLSVEAFCLAPTNTNVEMTTATNALFSWDAMPNATYYQVKYRLKGTTAWSTSGTANPQRNVPNLTAKKYYQYKVRAQCGSEWSDFSDIQLFYTSTCDVPTGVASIYLDNTRMRVRWDNNPDEIKGKIRYRAVGITNWITQNSQDGNNFLYVNNLPANALIQYKVRSNCDGNDWSAYSALYTHDLSSGGARLEQEASTSASTKIYPNPTRNILNIEFKTVDAEDVNIIISDHLGKTVHALNGTYHSGIQTESIDMSQFPNGYYFITIRSGERSETLKLMKMK